MAVFSNWNGEYPILVNPTWEEIVLLNKWDTVRVCVEFERKNIGLASGFGNTHDSITKAMVAHGFSTGLPSTYILFREDGRYWFNMEDVSGQRKVPAQRIIHKEFLEEHGAILLDVISAREQA